MLKVAAVCTCSSFQGLVTHPWMHNNISYASKIQHREDHFEPSTAEQS
jgi:hypothetical protein